MTKNYYNLFKEIRILGNEISMFFVTIIIDFRFKHENLENLEVFLILKIEFKCFFCNFCNLLNFV